MVHLFHGDSRIEMVNKANKRLIIPLAQSFYFSGKYELHQKLWLSTRLTFLTFLASVGMLIATLCVFPYSNFANYPGSVSPFLYLTFLTM